MEVSRNKVPSGHDSLPCKPCEDSHLSTYAHGFCGECEMYMCNKCFDAHKHFKVCRGHTLTNVNKGIAKKEQKGQVQRCDKHVGDLQEEEASPKKIQQIVPAAEPPKPQPLLDRQLICRNITIDGEYLSYADSGCGNAGLYVERSGRYLEVEVLSMGQRGTIAIGLVQAEFPENHLPGKGDQSIGFYPNDGMLYYGSGAGRKFGPKCNVGDRIGCGLIHCRNIWLDRSDWFSLVFFTRNGKKVGEKQIPWNHYHAAVGMHSAGEKVRVILDAERPTLL